MLYADQMTPGGMIYIPCFVNIYTGTDATQSTKGAPGTHIQVKQHTNELQNGRISKIR
jgi:hypothetical protein